MSFMQETINQSIPIWNRCVLSPFVQEMKEGTLPFEKFKQYIIQDSIYLKHYARVYGKAIYHSTVLKDIQLFYSVLNFVSDTENVVRLNYLKQFNMADSDIEKIRPLPANKSYIDFMLEVAERGNVNEILMAVLPCMLSYSYIFREVAADPVASNSRYWDFIQDYTEQNYFESCKRWTAFADAKCSAQSPDVQKDLSAIFERASLLELDFWRMAYQN